MGNVTGNSKYESVQLSDHHKISMSKYESVRLQLLKSWKRYYQPYIYKQCQNEDGTTNRKKLSAMSTMCGSMKICNINNIKKEVWYEGSDNNNRCESVYVQFDIDIDVWYNHHKQRLTLSTLFDDEFSANIFDDKYSHHWHHSLAFTQIDVHKLWSLFLTETLTGDEKVSSIITEYLMNERDKESMRELNVIENNELDPQNLMLVAGLIGIHQSDIHILETILEALWKWFISNELITFRRNNAEERMIWRRSSSLTTTSGTEHYGER